MMKLMESVRETPEAKKWQAPAFTEAAQDAGKWHGKAFAEVPSAEPAQVWPLLADDFFGLNKWFPTLSACMPVHGVSGEPGCVRYCAGFKTPVDGDDGPSFVNWTKQKMLSVDRDNMTFVYSIVDGNTGFKSYVSTVKVVAGEGGGCGIEWCYEVEPVDGWRLEDLDLFIGSGLRVMAERMEEALSQMRVVTSSTN